MQSFLQLDTVTVLLGWVLANHRHESKLLNLKRNKFPTVIIFHLLRKQFRVCCLPGEFRNSLFCNFCNAPRESGPTCWTRRFTVEALTGAEKTHGTNSSWQWNNAVVLFIFCFDTASLSGATHWVAYSSNYNPVCVFANASYSGMRPFVSCRLLKHLPAHTLSTRCTLHNRHLRGTLESSIVHWCTLWPPSWPPSPCRVIKQTSGCQNAREHFYPVMPTYSLFINTLIWKSACLLEILFLAQTYQPYSREK